MVTGPRPIALSIVVPVLDEAKSIERTLRNLSAQDGIDEIIVVDNGSADETVRIVQELAAELPKIELLHEPIRGIASARNAGFDKARGEIIARTDGDTIVSPEWSATIRSFLNEHPETAAISGLCTYHDSPVGYLLKFGQWVLVRFDKLGGPVGNMYGPNMAIRRDAWLTVREHTQIRPDLAEDLDLAICLARSGLRIEQLTNMKALTSARRRRTSPRRFWQFQMIGLRTLRDHGLAPRLVDHATVAGAWTGHTLQWPIYRYWDFDRRRFSLRPGAERVSAVGS
ncbi:glycosyltransferase family 2 protein [Nocardia sp. NBC_00511]|uniref:glycosyltransferase family 2 protein n=1 Tax=Nocardia sp. NBC_00511 TaxID=2903591 RepID=UPI0030E539EA